MANYTRGQEQYRTIAPLIRGQAKQPDWIPDEDKERLAAYDKYQEIYWNNEEAFRLMRRGAELQPIYVPNGMTICDETAHYMMKGLKFQAKDSTMEKFINPWLRRSRFMNKFTIAKHSGVVRGDFVLHMVADKDEDEGRRIKILDVDPHRFFPVYDDDDLDVCNRVHLAEAFTDTDGKIRVRRLTYERVKVGGGWRVITREGIYETDPRAWASGREPLNRWSVPEAMLPEGITEIPVYHFKNKEWQGDLFGSSEMRGFERIQAAVNQGISDNELALALEGLGVYATDAGSPVDQQTGQVMPWVIAPGQVMEIPTGSTFRRVEGIKTIDPIMEHLKYLEHHAFQASGTANLYEVDAQTAQSGIALTVHFMPTLAKLEERELLATDTFLNMFEDWKAWYDTYEGEEIDDDIEIQLGEKLPINRTEFITELNNMLDRDVISRAEFRRQMEARLGYVFADDIEQEIEDEQTELSKFQISGGPFGWPEVDPETGEPVNANGKPVGSNGLPLNNGDPRSPNAPAGRGSSLPKQNQSNNRSRPNESKGTEPGQTTRKQQMVRPR